MNDGRLIEEKIQWVCSILLSSPIDNKNINISSGNHGALLINIFIKREKKNTLNMRKWNKSIKQNIHHSILHVVLPYSYEEFILQSTSNYQHYGTKYENGQSKNKNKNRRSRVKLVHKILTAQLKLSQSSVLLSHKTGNLYSKHQATL